MIWGWQHILKRPVWKWPYLHVSNTVYHWYLWWATFNGRYNHWSPTRMNEILPCWLIGWLTMFMWETFMHAFMRLLWCRWSSPACSSCGRSFSDNKNRTEPLYLSDQSEMKSQSFPFFRGQSGWWPFIQGWYDTPESKGRFIIFMILITMNGWN